MVCSIWAVQELESSIHKIIQEHLDWRATEQDLILSGMSMGTYGAVYCTDRVSSAGYRFCVQAQQEI